MRKLFLALTFFILAASMQAQFLNNLTVSGTIKNPQKQWVYLSELGKSSMIPVDSAKISANNSFYIATNISKANFFQLTNGGKQYAILILQPNEQVSININAKAMLQPTGVKGSPTTIQLYNMLNKVNAYEAQLQKLNQEYQKVAGTAKQDSVGQVLSYKFANINQQKDAYLKAEINKNPSLASLLFLDKIDIDKNLPLYQNVDKVLYAKYKDNAFVKDLHHKVASKLKLAPGSMAPEINLPDTAGNNIALSSLRGKVVLIDFWASWCSPCRREMPNNVKLYNKYHSQGYEIYGVSLDKERSNWIKAIKDDHLNWIHVSDLRYWQSKAARNYGVNSIPFTVLIGRDGKIIAVGLRGVALEQKLQQLFAK